MQGVEIGTASTPRDRIAIVARGKRVVAPPARGGLVKPIGFGVANSRNAESFGENRAFSQHRAAPG